MIRCSAAGSLRRFKEVIGDIDLLASSKKPAEVIEFFVAQPGIIKVTAKGETKASVILDGGIQCDLRVVSDAEFPFALAYFTGSKEHNIVMRQRAIQRGLRLNEYGLFKSKEETRDPKLLVPCQDRGGDFCRSWTCPSSRRNCARTTANSPRRRKNDLPRLIEWTDLKGALHNHSTWSDGHNTLEEIARVHGRARPGILGHHRPFESRRFRRTGWTRSALREQIKEIKKINEQLAGRGSDFRLLTGTEVDILKDRLDFDDDLLAELDVVVASLHVPSQQRGGEHEAADSRGGKSNSSTSSAI